MKRTLRSLIFIVIVLSVIGGSAWAWLFYGAIGGRTGREWLKFADNARLSVAYAAGGVTSTQGRVATFTLEQGLKGCYRMQVVDTKGQICTMGDDGQYAWYEVDGKKRQIASAQLTDIPVKASPLLIGSGELAGRQIVRLLIWNGLTTREISLDSRTGVILSLVTRNGLREISRMDVHEIDYKPVAVGACKMGDDAAIMHSAAAADIRQLLGSPAVEPRWLPTGMKKQGMFREWCDCCRQDMAVIRYSDGLRSVTLFEAGGSHHCAMGDGCQMAGAGKLIESRQVGKVTVTAVSDLDRGSMKKLLASLR